MQFLGFSINPNVSNALNRAGTQINKDQPIQDKIYKVYPQYWTVNLLIWTDTVVIAASLYLSCPIYRFYRGYYLGEYPFKNPSFDQKAG